MGRYVSEGLKNFLKLPGIEDALNAHDWKTIRTELLRFIINGEDITIEFIQVMHALGVEKEMFKAFQYIPSSSFWANSSLTNYDIPEGVDTIYEGAFAYCENLESIDLPNSIANIHNNAFVNCNKLKNVNLPDSLTFLGERAFFGSGLESIEISSNVTHLGAETFKNCDFLKSATINSSYLSEEMFKGCKALKDVKIGKNVKDIDAGVFMTCNNLHKIDYEGTSEEWKNIYILPSYNTKLFGLKIKCADGVTLKYSPFEEKWKAM